MENMLQHNVMIFPSSGNKTVIVTVVDSDMFNEGVPEKERGQIRFAMAQTRQAIMSGGTPTMTIDTRVQIPADEWAKQCGEYTLNGRSIGGIITSPVWFCRKVKDIYNGLF